MADLPWSAYQLDGGPFKVLSALWRYVSGETLWEARGAARGPWVCPSAATLAERTARSLRRVESDLQALRAAGWIERAWGELGGRKVYGWTLADPDRPRTDTDGGVTPTRATASTRNARSAKAHATPASAPPAPGLARPHLLLLTDAAVGAAADASAHRHGWRGHTDTGDGLALSPEALVGILGEVHLPAPAQRIVADRPTLRRARAILEVPQEGRDEADVLEARRERFQEVLAIAMDFAQICKVEPDQLRWWCGQMFEQESQRRDRRDDQPGTGRWEEIKHRVALRRGAQHGLEDRSEGTG